MGQDMATKSFDQGQIAMGSIMSDESKIEVIRN